MLSVSSNGSNWVKRREGARGAHDIASFSILERIELGETASVDPLVLRRWLPFSILERIELGETGGDCVNGTSVTSFSILERIELGETAIPGSRVLGMRSFSILERIELGETW